MSAPRLIVVVKFAWWAKAYAAAVLWYAEVTGSKPDLDKLTAMIQSGVSVKVIEL
jgi:hypothetical protein